MARAATGVILLAFPLLLASGCGLEDEVSGLWQSEGFQPIEVVGESPDEVRYLEGGYAQLVLGQYGSEVAGVVKVYDDTTFQRLLCPCSYVFNGRMKNGVLTFAFQACAASGEKTAMNARLEYRALDEDEAVLSGQVFHSGDSSAYANLQLARLKIDKGILPEDKLCEESAADSSPTEQDGVDASTETEESGDVGAE